MTSAVQIRVLKHRAAGDTLAARLRLESVLGTADLAPTGMPAGASLYVRRLVDPRPGRLDLAGALWPPPDWEQAVQARLATLLRSAARPAREPVASSAEAVYFADEAERLVSLVSDWASGLAATRWWWRLEGEGSSLGGIVATLRRRPADIPSVMDRLCANQVAITLLRAFDRSDAADLAASVVTTFGLSDLRPVLATIVRRGDIRPAARYRPLPSSAGPESVETAPEVALATPAPWAGVVPESIELSDRAVHEFLLGVTVQLRRAPGPVRSSAYASAARRWAVRVVAEGVAQTAAAPNRAVRLAPSGSRDMLRSQPRAESSSGQPSDATRPPLLMAQQSETDVPTPAAPLGRAQRHGNFDHRGSPPRGSQLTDRSESSSTGPERPALGGPNRDAIAQSKAVPTPPIAAPVRYAEPTRTRLGGAFYLLNVAQALDLYADFTQPMTPGIALDPWDFVALVARRLLADRDASDDPVWALLDELAGRPSGAQPGDGFRPPADWRIEPDWLVPFREDRRRWRWSASASGRRLVVRHPGGFPIIDVSISDGAPDVVVRQALSSYRPHPPMRREPGPPAPRRRSRVDRWVDPVAAYVAARLATALGVGQPKRAIELLLHHEADVFVTASTVDVQFSLDGLPIAVRVAGLDRDPGWFPAARRTIAFHFA